MQKALDVITIGEAMAMFVATETGELAEVEHFMKRVAGAELNVGPPRLKRRLGKPRRRGQLWPLRPHRAGERGDRRPRREHRWPLRYRLSAEI